MMDWLAKMLKLPQHFMSGGKGGGVIQVKDVSHFYVIKLLTSKHARESFNSSVLCL